MGNLKGPFKWVNDLFGGRGKHFPNGYMSQTEKEKLESEERKSDYPHYTYFTDQNEWHYSDNKSTHDSIPQPPGINDNDSNDSEDTTNSSDSGGSWSLFGNDNDNYGATTDSSDSGGTTDSSDSGGSWSLFD